MKTRGFNYLPSIQLGKKKQGLIYYISHNYYLLPAGKRAVIDEHCVAVGGKYAQALKRFMTSEDGIAKICIEHYIGSPTTIYRLQREYYEKFPLQELIK